MRYLKYAFLGTLAIVLATLALANGNVVPIQLLPDDLATLAGFNIGAEVPLFIIILTSLIAGILVGFVWEWFREMKHRSEASTQRRDKEKLERELKRLKAKEPKSETDEVLALLEPQAAK